MHMCKTFVNEITKVYFYQTKDLRPLPMRESTKDGVSRRAVTWEKYTFIILNMAKRKKVV